MLKQYRFHKFICFFQFWNTCWEILKWYLPKNEFGPEVIFIKIDRCF